MMLSFFARINLIPLLCQFEESDQDFHTSFSSDKNSVRVDITISVVSLLYAEEKVFILPYV